MTRQANTHGGGAKTNANGLYFEQTTDLESALKKSGYNVLDHRVYHDNQIIGLSVQKYSFYKLFLEPNNINYKQFNSKQWLPDECLVNYTTNTVYIIEKKFQNTSGSVDEKLPNCDFKKKEYEKLCHPIEYSVEFLYVFNDWFHKKQYRDTLAYIKDVRCNYFFNTIPLDFLGL